MSNKEVLLQKIADARTKESVSWVGVLVGGIMLLVGVVLALQKERSLWTGRMTYPYQQTGLIIAVIGFLILVVAGGNVADFSKQKSEYLKELEGLKSPKNVCPKCGKEMSPDFKICPYCGENLIT